MSVWRMYEEKVQGETKTSFRATLGTSLAWSETCQGQKIPGLKQTARKRQMGRKVTRGK